MADLVITLFYALVLVSTSLLGYVILHGIYNLTLHPLHSYPGPLLWRAYSWPYARSMISGRIAFDISDIHKKNGHVVRIAPNELSYTSSSALKPIYGHHNPGIDGFSEFDKDRTAYGSPVNGVWGILAAPAEIHSRYRRMFSHAFSEKGMRGLQPRIQGYVDLLIQRLKEYISASSSTDEERYIDMREMFNWTTFDIIGDLAFGESFHCLENLKTDPWISALFGAVKAIPFLHMIQRYKLASLIPYITPTKLRASRAENYRRNQEQIEKRLQLGTTRGDFWDSVIKNSDFEKGTGMNKSEMVSNASILVVGGSETTASLLTGTTYFLLKHPEQMKKLNTEVRAAFKSEEEINLISVGSLEYMLAVLNEAMRIYPPVPNQGSRVVPKGGAVVDGKWVAGGTSIQVQRYAACHSPSNFTHPEAFVPERWLPNPPEEYANDDRAASAPFSLGPRNCIGKSLAYAEMRLILAKMCFNFDMELDEERCGDWFEGQKVYMIWEKGPLWVKLRTRKGIDA